MNIPQYLIPVLAALCFPALCFAQPSSDKAIGVSAVVEAVESLPSDLQVPNRYALIIGASDYADDRIPDLPACGNDARGLYDVLTDPTIGMFPKDHVTLLTDDDVTEDTVVDAIDQLGRRVGPEDLVLVFFSGHGAVDSRGRSYWVMQDTKVDKLRATALAENEITDLLGDVKTTRLVTIIDACYSASTANLGDNKSILDLKNIFPEFDGKGRIAMTASAGDQLSVVIPEGEIGYGYSAFAYHLIEGLKGQADGAAGGNDEGVITLDELWGYVKDRTETTARRAGGEQQPQLKGAFGSRFMLTVNGERLVENTTEHRSRMTRLRKLFIDGVLDPEQYREAETLLKAAKGSLDEVRSKRAGVYRDLADGTLDPLYLAAALSHIENNMISDKRKLKPNVRRSTNWVKPGEAPIRWQEEYSFANDPRNEIDYQIGGQFTELLPAQPSKLTPVLAEDIYARRIGDLICESLAEYDTVTTQVRGVLAEAWQYDPDGLWLRVKLRDNINFSDGVEITAEDVRWTFHDFINNTELETESLRSVMTRIETVEVISQKIVEFTFNTVDAYNIQSALTFYILPKHFYTKLTPAQINESTSMAMGSGPFKLKNLNTDRQWTPGQDIVLVRNERYWGPMPALESVKFKVIQNSSDQLNEFRYGDASMFRPSSPQYTSVSHEQGWDDKAYSLNWVNVRSGYSFIGWQCGLRNGKLTPFHDKRVRQAMTLILDRELMIRDIYSGIGEVAIGPNNPPSPAANPELVNYPYDPEQARELLAEAGWIDHDGNGILEDENGVEFEFEFTRASGGQTIERMQKYLIDQCASVGIRCIPKVTDWSLYDQILKTRDFDAITLGWSASAPESDPDQIWHTDSIQNQGHNFIQWDAGQDKYIDAIKVELDYEKRMAIFHEFHALIHEEQPYTFLRVSPWLRFISKDYRNVHTYPMGLDLKEIYYTPSTD